MDYISSWLGGSVHLWAYHLSGALAASDSKGQPHLQRPALCHLQQALSHVSDLGIQLATLPDLCCLIRARFIHLKQVSGSSGRSTKSPVQKNAPSTSLNLWVSNQISRNNGKSRVKAKVTCQKPGSSYNLDSSHKLHFGFYYTWQIWERKKKKNLVQIRREYTQNQ